MRFTLLTSMALLGLALTAATESSTDDVGSTKVTDGTLDVNYCGERCEYDWECRRGNRCHECRKQHHERYGRCRERYD
ncbi:hypothetical protein ABZX51_011134 [Aspergillus tubingensis]|uniref:Uncharacterized protein n=3 Tax=Aspergillus subgen. Circumdati TaxID=2720871 RepID=A0A1L9N2N8_ASPTC|nr:hypothetical protein BO79DRAFT_251865 [Aspergillus costaricaensis CBS 115574]XP_035360380.1 amidohydrolase family protein [Aspergillus tubingensis]OJI83559.1 hypothetical protein ASPTUDRAFT_200995 [Aspergillus tubingensis CBS 134.48]GAQ46690.1 hypothetical protein AKAW_02836 [Aspergillus niger]RAK91789.1 hypothetical protein BO79DRAFT_251865 [Aspergillus costaricaensis CBS 115574]GFN19576.1 amidohydrolase family protein [Aspergillus tubingensis]GLA96312.1 hypothetical protein AtubIFM57143_